MFNLRKRATFSTVGELEEILRELPRNTLVTICGDSRCYYHEELDRSVICLDCEDLEENYKEAAEYFFQKADCNVGENTTWYEAIEAVFGGN